MTSHTRADRDAGRSEEWRAARGVLVAVTAGTGGMLTLFGIASGAIPLALVPTVALVLGERVGWSDRVIGWAGAAIWLTIVPAAHGEALLAPLAMALAWVAVAVGPERLGTWVAADWNGPAPAPSPAAAGWIEDDLSVR